VNPFKFLLGSATMPANLRSSLEAEGITFLAEGLTGSITYRNYRAPGKYYGIAKQGTAGAIGISGQRPNQLLEDPYGNRTLDNYLNPAAFAYPALGELGTHVRGSIEGPAYWAIDLALARREKELR